MVNALTREQNQPVKVRSKTLWGKILVKLKFLHFVFKIEEIVLKILVSFLKLEVGTRITSLDISSNK